MRKLALFTLVALGVAMATVGASRPAETDAGPLPDASAAVPPLQPPLPAPARTTGQVPNALIILDSQNVPQMRRAIETIEQQHGQIAHVFPTHALIGFLPPAAEQQLIGVAGILAVHRSWVTQESVAAYGPQALQAAYVWNHNFVRPRAPSTPVPGAPAPHPLVGDVREPGWPAGPPPVPDQPGNAPGYYQTSEFMVGKVAVGIILPESNGALDPSTEDWTNDRIDQVVAEIQNAMNWWARFNPSGSLSFYYDVHTRVPTQYEPINRSSDEDGVWISETLSTLGYSGSDWVEKTFNYLNTIRGDYGTDWAVVAFVVDSLNDPDGMFTDGYFGYTYGFLVVMTYDNDYWHIENMDTVMAHEFAHDFGAGDEYCVPGYWCCWCGGDYGYLGIPNSNCEAGCDRAPEDDVCDGDDSTPDSDCHNCSSCVEITCLMRRGGIGGGVCDVSQRQVGMRDLDGDGILDPVDTFPDVTIDPPLPDEFSGNTPTISGVVQDVPHDSPTHDQVTINHITSVWFQVDDGQWQAASATDGAFDETTEQYTLTTSPLAPGEHTISISAFNRVGNYSVISDSFAVANTPPTVGTVHPSSGSGEAGVTVYFTTTWSDADGWQDLKQCYLHIGAGPSGVNNVTLLYSVRKNKLWLLNDGARAWTGGFAPGSAHVLENSQAKVYCEQTRRRGAGDTLGVRWAIEFKPGYSGTRKLGLKCKDMSKARAKGAWKGTWTIE
jgi:hypothetical protein